MRVLILGATGMLGREIFRHFNSLEKYDLFTSGRAQLKESTHHIQYDLLKDDNFPYIQDINPDILIYCSANTDIENCEKNKHIAERLHATIPAKIAKVVKKLVYISTDSVFDGANAPYKEESIASPINFYGVSKARGEKLVLDMGKSTIVVRTNIFGFNSTGQMSLVEWAIENLKNGNTINGFTDSHFNAIAVSQLAAALDFLIDIDYSGVINVAGDYSISKYHFLVEVAQILGYDTALIVPSSSNGFFNIPRPKNTTLAIEKLKQLGFSDVKLQAGMNYIRTNVRGKECQ